MALPQHGPPSCILRAPGGRYELLAPAASYAAAHEPAARRLRLAAAAAAMMAEEPGLAPGVAAQRAAVEASAGARAAPGAADVAFVEAALLRAGSRVRREPRSVLPGATEPVRSGGLHSRAARRPGDDVHRCRVAA
jgi:hypothetical protein